MPVKITKGDWKTELTPNKTIYVQDQHGFDICELCFPNDPESERLANAKAITALPKLIEALMEAEEHLSFCCPLDGWGLLDKGADKDRQTVLKKVREALGEGGLL